MHRGSSTPLRSAQNDNENWWDLGVGMTTDGEMVGMDEFDGLLDDVLRSVANPELPERVRVQVRTRVWVREPAVRMQEAAASPGQVAGRRGSVAVFAPAAFEERMHPKRDARSTALALLLHAAAIAAIFWVGAMKMGLVAPKPMVDTVALTTPPAMAPAKDVTGGGGGQRGAAPVSKGQLPKFAETQITPPKAPPMEEAKIHMPDASIEVQKDLKLSDSTLPNFGDPSSALLGSSLGNGRGTGIGVGSGAGIGPGAGGNYGGGLMKVGGGVSTPVLVYKVEPEFSEEARKAKFMGNVLVSLVVDPQGLPRNIRVARGVGMGLDEKAVEAVRQYKFKPAMAGGKPVAVALYIEVDFQIF